MWSFIRRQYKNLITITFIEMRMGHQFSPVLRKCSEECFIVPSLGAKRYLNSVASNNNDVTFFMAMQVRNVGRVQFYKFPASYGSRWAQGLWPHSHTSQVALAAGWECRLSSYCPSHASSYWLVRLLRTWPWLSRSSISRRMGGDTSDALELTRRKPSFLICQKPILLVKASPCTNCQL